MEAGPSGTDRGYADQRIMLDWMTLSQAAVPPAKRADVASVVILVMVFIGIVMGLGLVILLLRRKLFQQAPAEDGGMGILGSLRAARDRGDMTQEEYEQAKRVLAARAKERMLARDGAREAAREGGREGGGGAVGEGRVGKGRTTDVEAIRRRGEERRGQPGPDNAGGGEAESERS